MATDCRLIQYTNGYGDVAIFGEIPYTVTSIDGLDPVAINIQETRAPYQDGSTYLDCTLDTRTISIEGAIVDKQAWGDVDEERLELIRLMNPKSGQGELLITLPGPGGVDYTYKCNAIPRSAPRMGNRGQGFQRFQVQFYCTDPYLYATNDSEQELQVFGVGFYVGSSGTDLFYVSVADPKYFGLLGSINGSSDNINNEGHVSCPVRIRFTGPATNPKVLLSETGEYVQVTKTLLINDYIDIDTAFGVKTVMLYTAIGATYTNANQYLNLASTFFQLAPGGNTLTFSESGGSAGSSAVIEWTKRYLGA
jgi:phage-related protein